MNNTFGLLLAILLIGANAFFVAAEFSLISARRDRLEALAEQGKVRAVIVIRAGEQLSSMLAGSQLGVTIASLLLGRIGVVERLMAAKITLTYGKARHQTRTAVRVSSRQGDILEEKSVAPLNAAEAEGMRIGR